MVSATEEPMVYTVAECARLLNLGRTAAYQAVQRGDIPTIRIGRRILVPKKALEHLLEQADKAPVAVERS